MITIGNAMTTRTPLDPRPCRTPAQADCETEWARASDAYWREMSRRFAERTQ